VGDMLGLVDQCGSCNPLSRGSRVKQLQADSVVRYYSSRTVPVVEDTEIKVSMSRRQVMEKKSTRNT